MQRDGEQEREIEKMNFIFTAHAKRRMAERSISSKMVYEALRNPAKVLYDDDNKILFKKLYKSKRFNRLLLVVAEEERNRFKIITVIDTSKIKKYL